MKLLVNIKKTGIILVILMMSTLNYAQNSTIQKSSLKILYIGQHPDEPEGYYYGGNLKVNEEHNKWRANDFMNLLQQYFNHVELVYGHEYKEPMSANFDVTIFDAVTPVIREKETGIHPEMGYTVVTRHADYLSEKFDAAAIMVGGVPAVLMQNKNSKIKWLCHCLREHAFGFNSNHKIFNTPYKVDIAYESVTTPSNFFKYYSGRNLEETMQMMRIQNTDTPKGYAPGFVSFPGFGDSPDAEAISNGPCIKSVNSVAIGRHGNFFQWGYRASPKYMTKAAKLAFINAIHYISTFKGEKPYVLRKASARSSALDSPYIISDKGYEQSLKKIGRINDKINAAKAQKAAGKETELTEYYAKKKHLSTDRTFAFRYIPQELVNKYVDDWNAYLEYYEMNYKYLIPDEKNKNFIIDNEVKSLGIANNDIKLLDTCIEMLLKNDRQELALKILIRYTNKNFAKPKDWKKWLNKNRDQLFFTETGGYKFLVDQ